MNLLVAGSKRVDAGKTTFATGLVDHADSVGFKPRAGNDYWHSHDDCRTALSVGRLYGKDATRLAAASTGEFEPETINSIHRLWRPSPGGGTGILGQADREFVVDRVGDTYLVNGTIEVPNAVREALPLDRATVVSTLEELNAVMERQYVPALADLARDVAATDRAVVESYGDIARPIREPAPDAVAVVEPRRIRLYDGDRFVKACEVAQGGQRDGVLEQRVGAVVDLLEPAATRQLDPLTEEVRSDPDAVAKAYAETYREMRSLA